MSQYRWFALAAGFLFLFLPLAELPGDEPSTVGQEVASRDLVIEPVSLSATADEPQGEASINWSTGILRVSGRGWGKPDAASAGQRRAQARVAAQNVAQRNLAYALQGAPVTSDATFQDYLRRQGGRASIDAFVRYDRVADPRELPDGGIEVTLEVLLRGKRELAEVLFGGSGKPRRGEEPKPRMRPSGDIFDGLTSADDKGPFTGLVVVATGLETMPVLRFSLFDENGEFLYGPGVAGMDAVTERGLVDYVRSVDAALRLGRAGDHPLVVLTAGINARNPGDLILSAADAGRLQKAGRRAGFLKNAEVVVVLGAKPGE